MSAQFNNTLAPFGILVASLLGSLHCAGMCGGLIAATTSTRTSVLIYHLARLFGYLLFGALAGGFGQLFLNSTATQALSTLTTFGIGILFIYMAFETWNRRPVHLPIPQSFSRLFLLKKNSSPILVAASVGFGSVFLPCGWLHAFILSTIPLKSALVAAGLMFCFWVGTLPVLTGLSLTLNPILIPLRAAAPRISACLLLMVGLLSIAMKFNPEHEHHHVTAPTATHDHHSMHHSQ